MEIKNEIKMEIKIEEPEWDDSKNINEETALNKDDFKDNDNSLGKMINKKISMCALCPFVCDEDNRNNRSRMRKHNSLVHNICQFCKLQFENVVQLKEHDIDIHKGQEKNIKCGIDCCEFEHSKLQNMLTHIRTIHESEWLHCHLCEFKTGVEPILKKHIFRHQKIRLPKEKPEEIPESKICDICGYETDVLWKLQVHIKRIHATKSISCELCPFLTKSNKNLREHMKNRHLEKNQKCDECDFTYANIESIKRHKKVNHSGQRYMCTTCSFETKTIQHLHQHEKTHQLPNLQCTMCDFKTKTENNLRRHIDRHNGKQLFCPECEFSTLDSGNLSTHKKSKHGIAKYKCDICNYETKLGRNLRHHKQTKHIFDLVANN